MQNVNTNNYINSEIPFRTSCKDCEFNDKCFFEYRMIKKRCYIDTMAKKLNVKPETVVKRCNTLLTKIGTDNFGFLPNAYQDDWQEMSNSQRLQELRICIDYYIGDKNITATNSEVKVLFAAANCYFSAWRDEEYIHCAKCGALIKNSKQRNRKYCDNCKGYEPKEVTKVCQDCGTIFFPDTNREIRCCACQAKANKELARQRQKRYRERKRNDLRHKS